MLEFRILGPLEARSGDTVVRLGGVKQRSVLAILLLHANEVVSTDRLIDGLWGEAPPDEAPSALQAHVSRLRKVLPDGASVIVTRPPGYVARIEPGQLDLDRFEAGVEAGRAALRAGDARDAASLLRSALELWRGRPLADLEDEPFAREAAAHLDDLWVDAVSIRIDADLAAGRDSELVSELRALVRAHPLREGFREQLMLALYRSGRQAEALDVYTDARRRLDEDLGLEPGPGLQRLQQRILVQDPELRLERSAGGPAPARRRRLLAAAALAATAVVGAVVTAGVLASRPGPPAPAGEGGMLVEIDSDSGAVVRSLPIGRTPTAVARGEAGVWLLDADTRIVSRLDPAAGTVSTFSTGATPTDVAVGAGGVWVGNGRRSGGQFVGPIATSVVRVDPASSTERAEVALPRTAGAISNQSENHLAATDRALWAVAPDFSLARIDAASSAVTAVSRPFPIQAVSAGPAGVWVLGVTGEVARIDAGTGVVVAQTRVSATSVGAIAVGEDAAWVTSPSDGTLWRVDAAPPLRLGSVDVGAGAGDVAADGDDVWVANPLAGTVTQVSAETVAVERTVRVGGVPRSLAAAGGRVWVALSNAEVAPAAGVEVDGVQALPATACAAPVYGGDGRPDVLVASDLPLQGGVRVLTTQMEQAIVFALRRHGFRAGPHRVAYQSCDDSIATTGLFDVAKCVSNAHAYAANRDVVGVVGPFNSPCAVGALPVLNRAPGGGLGMVGPFTSYVGLTRTGPGVPPDELARLYPTGRRTFVRVYPTDDLQMAALALTAQRLGKERVALLDDGEPGFGRSLARAFDRAAGRAGLAVVFHGSWDPQAVSYRNLARAVRRARPDAVVLSGLLDTNGAQVVRALRAELGRAIPLLANDGFTPVSLLLEQAGETARGMLVSLNGLTIERLGPTGTRFVREFAATQPGAEIQPSAVYAAQAAEVLLDAIARSDGTRASVVDELFRTKIEDGLLGAISFDENGDISASPVTILRAERPGGARTILGFEGASIVRLERPEARLVR